MVLFLKSHGLIAVFYNYMPLTSIKMCSHMQSVLAVDLPVWFVEMPSLLLASPAVSSSFKIIANMFFFLVHLCVESSSTWGARTNTASSHGRVTAGLHVCSPEVHNTKTPPLWFLSLCFQTHFCLCFLFACCVSRMFLKRYFSCFVSVLSPFIYCLKK